jgi:hypothetical protein
MTHAQWYAKNEEALLAKAEDRQRNQDVATNLLPLFEEQPQHWRAVYHLNDAASETPETFHEYLKRWFDHTPAEHRSIVSAIANRFEVLLPAAP